MSSGKKLLALNLPAGPAFLQAWERAWADGDAVLPLRPALPAAERERLLEALRPHAVLDTDGVHARKNAADVDPRTDLVVATSGSTGAPKGVELSREAVESSARASLERLDAGPGDPWLCCLPLDHLAGLQVVTRARLAGARLVLHDGFDPMRVASEPGIAFVSLVPTMLIRLLDAGVDVSRWRAILLGGAAAPAELLKRAGRAGARVVTTYGMTETAGGCVYDGQPLDGVEIALSPEGRVMLRGPVLFHGYRLDEERTSAAIQEGWFTSSDLGAFDPEGRLRVLGRVDDVVVTGGENVSLARVEELLAAHPSVAQAAAFAMPDDEWGQAVGAAIIARGAVPTLGELRAHMAATAPASHWPRLLLTLDAIPRTGLGKTDRAALAALALEQVPPVGD